MDNKIKKRFKKQWKKNVSPEKVKKMFKKWWAHLDGKVSVETANEFIKNMKKQYAGNMQQTLKENIKHWKQPSFMMRNDELNHDTRGNFFSDFYNVKYFKFGL